MVDQQPALVEEALWPATDSRGNWFYLDVVLKLRIAAGLYDLVVMTGGLSVRIPPMDWVYESRQLGLE